MKPAIAVVAACLGLVACSAGQSGSAEGSGSVATFAATGSDGFDTAMATGVIELKDGCLYLASGATERHVLAFEEGGLAWSGGALDYRETVIDIGANVAVGGREGTAESLTFLPGSCDSTARVWYVSPVEDIEILE